MASKILILSEGELQLVIEHTSATTDFLGVFAKVSFAVGSSGLFFAALTRTGQ